MSGVLETDLGIFAAPSTAVAGLVVMNDVRGGAEALVDHADLTNAAGAIAVLAEESATISADVDSAAYASGGSSIDWGGDDDDTVLAINGVIATNVVQGAAKATVSNATIRDGAGSSDLTVEAVNDSGITATNASQSYTSGGDSAGVTLAFNSVGWTAQNVLFNTIDAILGDPILAGLSFAGKADGGAQATLSDRSEERR